MALLTNIVSASLSTSKGTYEITSLGDAAWKGSIADLAEFEITVEFNYDPSLHSGVSGWFFDEFESNNPLTVLRIQWPLEDNGEADDTYQRWEFDAILSGYDIGASTGDKQTLSLSFKGTDSITESTITP